MRPKSGAFSRYRPRILTLIALFVVAATIVLANLSFDRVWGRQFGHKSYGWPLIWHRYVAVISNDNRGTVGWYDSAIWLAGNLAMWLVMLIAPAGACE